MNWFQALLAGAIQGFTEFLPVSSSGHLVILNHLSKNTSESNLAFTVFLHLATLLSVIIVYYKDIWMLIREAFDVLLDLFKGKVNFKTPERRFLLMVIIGTIPAVFAGLGIKLLGLGDLLENIFVVAFMLILTSVFMFLVDRLSNGKLTQSDAPYKNAWIVGGLQAIALLPGLSRSGSTIFGGVASGLSKEFAIKYAFILSIPAILGAGILEGLDLLKDGGGFGMGPFSLIIGFMTAMICGIIAIKFLRLLIKNNKFYVFGIYCLIASVFAFVVGLI